MFILKDAHPPSKIPLYVALSVAVILCILGIVLVAIGGAKLSDGKSCIVSDDGSKSAITSEAKLCDYSDEAKRVRLDEFLTKVKSTYYKMNPNNAVHDPDATPATIREDFSPYNAHPAAIRRRTDAALRLLKEALEIDQLVNSDLLKPREIKAISQVKHFLQSNFGAPYDENYYAGDWMLGPNKFCWQPICQVGSDLKAHFTYEKWGIQPKSLKDLEFVFDQLKKLNDSLMQYIENMKYGVGAGFVRSEEDCQDGLYSIQRKFSEVSQNGPKGKDGFNWVTYALVSLSLLSICSLSKGNSFNLLSLCRQRNVGNLVLTYLQVSLPGEITPKNSIRWSRRIFHSMTLRW